MIFISHLLAKLESMPDGWNYLHLKEDVKNMYIMDAPPMAKLVCISAKVYPATYTKTKWLLSKEVSENKIYEELLSYAIGVLIDNKEMPNGHIWIVFPFESEREVFQDDPVIIRFKGVKHEGQLAILSNFVDQEGFMEDSIMIHIADDEDVDEHGEMTRTPFNIIAQTIQSTIKNAISQDLLKEQKL